MHLNVKKMLVAAILTLISFGCTHTEMAHKDEGRANIPFFFEEGARAPVAKPVSDDGWRRASMAFPTGLESTSNILIEKVFPKTVHKGQPYHYLINVTNLTELTLDNVNVIEKFPSSFAVGKTDPEIYDTSGDRVAWALGKMKPHETRVIRVDGVANDTAGVPCCTEANFQVPALCLNTTVVDSGLEVSVNAPSESMMCNPIPVDYTVKNTGATTLRNVTVASSLPSQLTSDGANSINLNVGELPAGKSQTIQAMVMAAGTGDYNLSGSANGTPVSSYSGSKGFDNISADANTVTTNVKKPALELAATSNREKQYVGRSIDLDYVVTNTGNANADGTALVASVPANTAFQSATNGGTYTPTSNTVSWALGNLSPSDSRKVSMTVGGSTAGTGTTSGEANAVCASAATASTGISMVGISALLLEVIDVNDPVEVGKSTIYEIRVTNQGNATATNIGLTGTFEDDMSYITSSGNTPISNAGKNLTFGSFSLAPQEVVSWQIELKASGVGDHRFGIEMNSDQLTRPVSETESTTIY